MRMREAPWSAVAAATAFRRRLVRDVGYLLGRKAVAAATALQGASSLNHGIPTVSNATFRGKRRVRAVLPAVGANPQFRRGA